MSESATLRRVACTRCLSPRCLLLCSLTLLFFLLRRMTVDIHILKELDGQHRALSNRCLKPLIHFPELHALFQLSYGIASIVKRLAILGRECIRPAEISDGSCKPGNGQAFEPEQGLQRVCTKLLPLIPTWRQAIVNEWTSATTTTYGTPSRLYERGQPASEAGLELRLVDHCHATLGLGPVALDRRTRVLARSVGKRTAPETAPLLQFSRAVFGLSCCDDLMRSNESTHRLATLIRDRIPDAAVVCCIASSEK
jgi:hypothetical protein